MVVPMPTALPATAATMGFSKPAMQVQEGNCGAGVAGLAVQEVGEVVAGGEHVVLAAQQHHADMPCSRACAAPCSWRGTCRP
jgi:hypothetical protein